LIENQKRGEGNLTGAIGFKSKTTEFFRLRSGRFRLKSGRTLDTPYFFPIINIITGPPDVFDNGGIFRHIKRKLIDVRRIQGFMTQILHFTEFNVTRKKLDEWLEHPIGDRIHTLTGHRPIIFCDSGGYRLLYNSDLDIERFGMEATPDGILGLQIRFGGDFLATLDYPILPTLSDSETQKRQELTRKNAIEALLLMNDYGVQQRKFVFPVVHARDKQEMKSEVKKLLAEIDERGVNTLPFGISIGSLVPLSSSPEKALEIIDGAKQGIEEADAFDTENIPVHAFGVSTSLMPFAALLGVDTFDGTSYFQSAQNLRYFKPGLFSSLMFLDMERLECDCDWCADIKKGGFRRAKEIIRGQSYVKHEFDGRMITKSEIYANIALHNLENISQQIEKLKRVTSSRQKLGEIFSQIPKTNRSVQMVNFLYRSFPESRGLMDEMALSVISKKKRSGTKHKRRMQPRPFQTVLRVSGIDEEPKKSLELGPSDFDVMKKNYRIGRKKFMILLPCTQRKPYCTSNWHKAIRRRFEREGFEEIDYEKITISGNYGPVPQSFEDEPKILEYDFHLHSSNKERINLLAERTIAFLKKYGPKFGHVFGYCTSKAYREIIRIAFEEYPSAVLLPANLKVRRASQFLRKENLKELVDHIHGALE
jgi:tRNA-guanine family transglycosylase